MEQHYAVTVYDPDDARELARRMTWPIDYAYVNEARQTVFLGYGKAYEEAADWLEAHAFGKWNVLVVKTTQKEYGPGHPAAVPRDPMEVLGARRMTVDDVAWGNAGSGNRKPAARKKAATRKAPARRKTVSKTSCRTR